MKKTPLSLAFLFLAGTASADIPNSPIGQTPLAANEQPAGEQQAAQTIELDAPVTSAVLYLNGAALTRAAQFQAAHAGVYLVSLKNPAAANAEVQIEGGVLQSQIRQPAENADTEKQKLQLAIESANARLKLNRQMQQSLAESLKEHPENSETISQKIAGIEKDNTQLSADIARLNREVEQLNGAGSGTGETAEYRIAVNKAGTVRLTLREFSHDAHWQPASTVNLDTGKNAVDFTALANISQTGADWHNVQLSLALTPPSDAQRPAFYSESVGAEPPRPAAPERRAKIAAAAMPQAFVQAESDSFGAQAAAPVINAAGADFRIDLPERIGLRQNAQLRLPYYRESAKADVRTEIYGWTAGEPLLTAAWTQPKNLPFLPGNAEIQRDGLTVGSRYYGDFWQQGSEQRLSFGQDPAFSADITTPAGYTDKEGVFSKRKVLQKRRHVEIKNLAGAKRPAAFFARVPQPRNSDTEIKTVFSQKPSENNAENTAGLYRWDIGEIAAGKSWQLDFGYDVSYPAEMELY